MNETDSAFHLYYEWCDEQLRKIESEREQLDREYESGWVSYINGEDD